MLSHLSVENLALVEKGLIGFGPGLNVITGETGAGKSVLMGALSLLLGERADKRVIRTGEMECKVEGVFSLEHPAAVNAHLQEADLPPCEDGELIIRRTVKANGTGRTLVNDAAVTLQLLRKIGSLLVDMHGPYDHQSLLDPREQRRILDAAGECSLALQKYGEAYATYRETQKAIAELQMDEGSIEQQVDLLRYQLKELEEAALEENEEKALLEEHTLVGNAQNILQTLDGAMQALSEGEGNAADALSAAWRSLNEAARMHPDGEVWLEELDGIQTAVQELSATLVNVAGRIEADPERLTWLDDRLSLYSRMKKKYGPTVQEALQHQSNITEKLSQLENREQMIADLETELSGRRAVVETEGLALRAIREKAAAALSAQIVSHLEDLGFPHGKFAIDVAPAAPSATGIDDVDFGFAPNPGEPIRPLREIASSGEISRVMLSIKTILAEYDRIPVLVFDEIDANVGGEMGNAIGRKMADVARHRQLITITHLPQVAAYGETHLAVAKSVRDERSYTEVHELETRERVDEVARMLGGKDLTGVVSEHARELIEQAQAKEAS